jgi:hypothetical protein
LILVSKPIHAEKIPGKELDSTVRILIITAPGEYGMEMASLVNRVFGYDVEVTDTDRYAPQIDEYHYDGFIFLGGKYDKPPKQGFLDDMRNTRKPVLWINYHAWLLGDKFFEQKGFRVLDKHDNKFTSLITRFVHELTPTDTTTIEATGDKVLYWFFRKGKDLTPAAVKVGNFTYLAYSPTLNQSKTDFGPFLSALKKTFHDVVPSPRKAWKQYKQRLSDIRNDDFRTGVHLPVYVSTTTGGAHGYDSDFWHSNLIRIKKTGAEWITIIAVHYQEKVNSSEIYADSARTPTLKSLEAIIQDAHKLGLYVRLSLVVNIDKPQKDEWRGFIWPRDRDKWWSSYQAIALKIAKMAKEQEVEAFIIGAELNKMQSDNAGWEKLISSIRTTTSFDGLIGYQANFDALSLKWADKLDFVGIAAYWPLAGDRDPELSELKASWNKIKQELTNWIRLNPGIPLEFGEIGYVSQPYTSVLPYSWTPFRGKLQSTTEQRKCYRSLHDFLSGFKKIKGVHFFASTSQDGVPGDRGYTPFGKPAEKVMEEIIHLR